MTDVSWGKWSPPPRTDHNYIRTINGNKVWPLNPQPEEIDLQDIAWALSMRCRYNSHLPYLYSVAQHSLNVCYVCPAELAVYGLLHDAGEAYLPDVPKPIKNELPFFRDVEDNLMRVIAVRFNLDYKRFHSVKPFDTRLLQWEYAHFRPQVAGAGEQEPVAQEPKPSFIRLIEMPMRSMVDHFLMKAQMLGLK